MEAVEIHEGDLILRPWRPEDADAVYRACQDPLIQRWTSVPRPYLREHAERFTGQPWPPDGSAPLGVFDAGTGTMLGACGLGKLDRATGSGEFGYWTAPWARGRGVATGAARATARWALHHLGLRRLDWRAELGNHASRLVALRIGVQIEGILRDGVVRPDGRHADGWFGSLLPGELRETDAPANPTAELRARTFAGPQPALTAVTERGEKIILRPPAERDIDALTAACSDPESARWTTVPSPYRREDAEDFVRRHVPARWAAGMGIVCAITDADDGYAGSMELRVHGGPGQVATARSGEVGFVVAPEARGRGYAPAALRSLCAWGFDALGLDRVEWWAYVGNEASRRVARKAGFVEEGIARAGLIQRGEARDAWWAALLREAA